MGGNSKVYRPERGHGRGGILVWEFPFIGVCLYVDVTGLVSWEAVCALLVQKLNQNDRTWSRKGFHEEIQCFLKVFTAGWFWGKGLTWGVVFGKAHLNAACLCLSMLLIVHGFGTPKGETTVTLFTSCQMQSAWVELVSEKSLSFVHLSSPIAQPQEEFLVLTDRLAAHIMCLCGAEFCWRWVRSAGSPLKDRALKL